jgi:hypothetical protein
MMIGKTVDDVDVRMPEDTYDTGKHIPTFNAYLVVVVRDSRGNIVKVHRQRSHSPTANFIGLFLPLIYFTSNNVSYTITNATGGTCTYQPNLSKGAQDISYPNTATNAPTYFVMIQVGSGQQSNPYTATALAAPIANGSGAGQLVYQSAVLPQSIRINGNTAYFYVTQSFNNISGGTVTITEVGLLLQVQLITYSGSPTINCGQVLVWYDVLSSPISVPNGGSVTIYYTFTVNP